jgi:uncharacterized membrane protein
MRNKKEKSGIDAGWLLIISLIMIPGMFISICIYSIASTQKTVTITQRITKIDVLKNYMVIHFKNSDVYNVDYPSLTSNANLVVDFDESKNVTITLRYTNLLWLNQDDTWGIVRIIKY